MQALRSRVWQAIFACAVALGCGRDWPSVVSPRDVPVAGGPPQIARVVDLGDLGEIPASGPLPAADSDGIFVVGERILVEGSDFGRLPTVLVGGRPAGVIARTSGGGIVTAIPEGVPPGDVDVEVSHPRGKDSRRVRVVRWALVAQPDADAVYVVDVARTDATVSGTRIAIENPRFIRYAADGSVAYVASGVATGAEGTPGARGKLSVISMVASAGPRVVHEISCEPRFAVALAVADRAPLLAVVGERTIQLFSLVEPRRPAPYRPFPLPADIAAGGVVSADLEPTGKLLALLVADGNRLVSIDLTAPDAPQVHASVDLLPGERLPLVRDLRFSIDGETLWVVSGDNPRSVAAGKQPTRLTAVSLKVGGAPAERPVLAVWRTAEIRGATAPVRLAVARGQPVASGTTIRTPPEKAAVFLTALDARLFQLGGLNLSLPDGRARAHAVLRAVAEPGMLVRTDVGGGGGPLVSLPMVVSSVDLSPDSQLLLATAARLDVAHGADLLRAEFGLAISPLWGKARPRWVKLADLPLDAVKWPFTLGYVRIQP